MNLTDIMDFLSQPITWISLPVAIVYGVLRYRQMVAASKKPLSRKAASTEWALLLLILTITVCSQLIFGCVGWRGSCYDVTLAPVAAKAIVITATVVLIGVYLRGRLSSKKK